MALPARPRWTSAFRNGVAIPVSVLHEASIMRDSKSSLAVNSYSKGSFLVLNLLSYRNDQSIDSKPAPAVLKLLLSLMGGGASNEN
jgi:hypothetical protein